MKNSKTKFLKAISLAIIASSVGSLIMTTAHAKEIGDITPMANPFAIYEKDYYATGDLNYDGTIDIMDIKHMYNIFLSDDYADSEVADIDGNGIINIADFVSLKSIILGNSSFITLNDTTSMPDNFKKSHQINLNCEKNMCFEAYDPVSGKLSYYKFIDNDEGGERLNWIDEALIRHGNYLSLGKMSGKDTFADDIEKITNLNMPITAYDMIITNTFMEKWSMSDYHVYMKWLNGTFEGMDCYFNVLDNWYKEDSTVELSEENSLLLREVNVYDKDCQHLFSYSSVYLNSEEYETNKKFNFTAGMMPSEMVDKLGLIDLRAVQHTVDGQIGFNLD